MAFIRDLTLRNQLFSKKDGKERIIRVKENEFLLPFVVDDMAHFEFNLCVSTFSDRGMEIRAQGTKCKNHLPESLLNLVANYSAIFFQQSKGEHLFGPLPIPASTESSLIQEKIRIPLDDWYFMVYVFTAKDTDVKDERLISHGYITAGLFLIFYPKKYDYIIMSSKKEIQSMLYKNSGVIKNVQLFTNDQMSYLEDKLHEMVVQNYMKGKEEEIEDREEQSDFVQLRMSAEYQLTTINERLTTLCSFVQSHFKEKLSIEDRNTKSPKNEYGILFCYRVPEVITSLQYHVPPVHNLKRSSWLIKQTLPECIELAINNLRIWFLTPTQVPILLAKKNRSKTQTIGLFFGFEENRKEILAALTESILPMVSVKLPLVIGTPQENLNDSMLKTLKKQFQKAKETKIIFEHFPEEYQSIFSHLSWFYNILISHFLVYNKEQQLQQLATDFLLSKNERQDITALFSRTFGSNDDSEH